jgi:ATP-dependent RNA helicase DDX54/DBP10
MHHLLETDLDLKRVEYCVFDEADRLFEEGFASQLHEILQRMSANRQTLLFSATMPKMLLEFARAGLKDPSIVRLDAEHKLPPNLKNVFFIVEHSDKPAALLLLLKEYLSCDDQTIVFASTRHHVEFVHQLLTAAGIASSPVYGSLDATARKINIAKFRSRQTNVLIVTDIAARGIDIPVLDNVINYDFPAKPKLFVHRVGRVARAGRSGLAFSFAAEDERPYFVDLASFLGKELQTGSQRDESLKNSTDSESDSSKKQKTEETKEVVDHVVEAIGDYDFVYGCFPRQILDEEAQYVAQKLNFELENQLRTCTRAYEMYVRTRPDAFSSAIRMSKDLSLSEVHPLVARPEDLTSDATALADLLQAVDSFRPRQTIFEVLETKDGVMKQKRKEDERLIRLNVHSRAQQQRFDAERKAEKKAQRDRRFASKKNAVPATSLSEDVQPKSKSIPVASGSVAPKVRLSKAQKRKLQKQQQRKNKNTTANDDADDDASNNAAAAQTAKHSNSTSGTSSTEFKDGQFYISSDNPHEHEERGLSISINDDLAFSLNADEEAIASKHRVAKVWDKKRKRYVGVNPGEQTRKYSKIVRADGTYAHSLRDGTKQVGTKVGELYARWKTKNHRSGFMYSAENDSTTTEMHDDEVMGADGRRVKPWLREARASAEASKEAGATRGGDDDMFSVFGNHDSGGQNNSKGKYKNKSNKRGNVNAGGSGSNFRSGSRPNAAQVRTTEEIRSLRKQRQKQKVKQMPQHERRKLFARPGGPGGRGGRGGGRGGRVGGPGGPGGHGGRGGGLNRDRGGRRGGRGRGGGRGGRGGRGRR